MRDIGRVIWISLLVGLLCLMVRAANAAEVGQVIKLVGFADVISSQESAARALQVGDAIAEQDVIRTKKRTYLILQMQDGSRLSLGENTRLAIAEYAMGDQPSSKLDLLRGRVRAVVSGLFSKRRNSFKMRTSTAVVGVQGTDFSVIAQALATQIYVYQGVVTVNSIDPNIALTQVLYRQQATIVRDHQPPAPPIILLPPQSASPIGSGNIQSIQSGNDQNADPAVLTPIVPVVPIPLPPVPTPPPR